MTITTQAAVLRAAVSAAVARACPTASDSQISDIARRIIAQDDAPEIIESGTSIGALRWASGSDLSTLLDTLKIEAPHLFEAAPADATTAATRAKLKAMKPADRLEAANADAAVGVTGAWVRDFRKGRVQ